MQREKLKRKRLVSCAMTGTDGQF